MKGPAGTLRRLTPFLAGTALAALLAAGAFALQTTLSPPTPADALALRVVAELQSIRSLRSDQRLSWLPSVDARCLAGRVQDTVSLSDGRTLAVDASHVVRTRGRWRRRLLIDAEARLAACPRLLVAEIGARLFAGERVLDGTLTFDRRPAYRLRVEGGPPSVVLIVDRHGLRPLAVRFRTARLAGSSRIVGVRLGVRSAGGSRRPRPLPRCATRGRVGLRDLARPLACGSSRPCCRRS